GRDSHRPPPDGEALERARPGEPLRAPALPARHGVPPHGAPRRLVDPVHRRAEPVAGALAARCVLDAEVRHQLWLAGWSCWERGRTSSKKSIIARSSPSPVSALLVRIM